MALNIGNVNFGVDANTQGLQKAVAQLNAFHNQVNKVAKSQAQGAAQVAAALGRQESAIKRAFQQTLNLQQQLRKVGAPASDISRVSNAFRTLTKEMSSGQLTTVEFTRSLDAFQARLGRSRRAVKDLQDQAKRNEVSKFATIMRDLESASVLAVGPLSGVGARIRSLGAIINRSTLPLAALIGSITAVTVGFIAMGRAAVNSSRIFEQAIARFHAATGSLALAKQEMNFVIGVSQELGLRIENTAKSFSRLTAATRGTKLEGNGTRDIFVALSQAAAALRLDTVEVDGAFRAVEQIISKGTLSAEELRQQLGERLPGAFDLAAKSMGVTTKRLNEMLKNGEIAAEDFIPNFAKALREAFGERAKDNVNSFTGSVNQLVNTWLLFSREFDKITGISKLVINSIQALTAVLQFMTDNIRTSAKIIGAIVGALTALAAPAILTGIVGLGRAILKVAAAWTLFNKAVMMSPIGKIPALLMKIGGAALGAAAGFFGMQLLMGDVDEEIAKLDESLKGLSGAKFKIKDITDAFNDMNETIMELNNEGRDLQLAIDISSKGIDPNFALPMAEAFNDLFLKATADDFQKLAQELGNALGRTVGADVLNISIAMAELTVRTEKAKEKFQELVDAADTTKMTEALRDAYREITDINAEVDVLNTGNQRAIDIFTQVTMKVEDFRRSMIDAGVEGATLKHIVESMQAALEDLFKAKEQQVMRDAIEDAVGAMVDLRAETEAMMKGPMALDKFNAITSEVKSYTQALIDAGVEEKERIRLVDEYTVLLQRSFDVQQRMAVANDFARSITDGLQDIIVNAESAKDALEGVLEAILRIATQQLILGPLEQSLTAGIGGFFGNMFGRGAAAATAAPAINPSVSVLPKAQHGASFKVGGYGGTDSQLVQLMATPGEQVDVFPLGKAGSAGGGSGTIVQVIDQRGAGAEPVEVQRSQQGGMEVIKMIIRGEVGAMFSDGSIDKHFRASSMPVRRRGNY